MNKELLDDEIEFPDEIISFLKVKYPKAHTDQEKAVLKQLEMLTEEKKELKDIISKKREETKLKSLPINIIPSDEAKEKAIKLVQDGTLLLTSKTKTIDLDDTISDSNISQKTKSRTPNDDIKKTDIINNSKSSAGKISFVSAGYAFTDGRSKSTEDSQDSSLKRSLSINSSNIESNCKKSRNISGESSDSEDLDQSNCDRIAENRSTNSSILRFTGHNMREDFVRRIVEPFGSIVSLELEERNDYSSNVVVTLENSEIARTAKEALDSQFLEGRMVNVYYKRIGSDFSQRRPFRRRRSRDFGRSRTRFPFHRNESFPQVEHDNILPSHFYSASVDVDDNINRKMRWTIPEDNETNESLNKSQSSSTSLKPHSERIMVQYDDLEPN